MVAPTTTTTDDKNAMTHENQNTNQNENTNQSSPSGPGTTAAGGTPTSTLRKDMNKSPGEVAFFKLLHSELQKCSRFFGKAKQEFILREERVREGYEIMKKPNSIMVNDKWSTMGKSVYRLYKDLMLLELYAIMTYCSFSKILKKHDKVTGYETRIAFMMNVVNKANFTHYPEVMGMIRRSEILFNEVSQKLLVEGNSALCEDERLFISMIHRFYGQIMDKAADEGLGADMRNKKVSEKMRQVISSSDSSPGTKSADNPRDNEAGGMNTCTSGECDISTTKKLSPTRHHATSLQTLLDENESSAKKARTCLSDDPDDETMPNSAKSGIKRSLPVQDNQSQEDSGKRMKPGV